VRIGVDVGGEDFLVYDPGVGGRGEYVRFMDLSARCQNNELKNFFFLDCIDIIEWSMLKL
jgi:hypothetical protein